jgi:hypothetical protein
MPPADYRFLPVSATTIKAIEFLAVCSMEDNFTFTSDKGV